MTESACVPDLLAYPTTVAELVDHRGESYPDADFLLGYFDGGLKSVGGREFARRVLAANAHLRGLGVEKGGRVALLSSNKPGWGIAFCGVVQSGAVVVPIDPLLTPSEYGHILRASRARILVAEEKFCLDVDEHRDRYPDLEHVIVLDAWDPALPGRPVPDVEPPATRPSPTDTCSILYTSGTTGKSKAVRLEHRNVVANIKQLYQRVHTGPGDTFVSVLPLFHTFESTCGFLMPLYSGARIIYAASLKSRDIMAAIRDGEGTLILGVPLLYEKLLAGIHDAVKKQPALKRAAFSASLGMVKAGRSVLKADWGRGIFRGLREKAGFGKMRIMMSGASALDPDVARGFHLLGLPLSQGYGLTETSPVDAVDFAGTENLRPASVGPCLWGSEVMVLEPDEEGRGELSFRGPQVMPGYLDNPEADAAVFFEADPPTVKNFSDRLLYAAGPGVDRVPPEHRKYWFRTGDIGWIDAEGYVYIAGRKKNVIVTAAGKNVYPEEIEEKLSRSPFIAECVALGRRNEKTGREDVAVVIVPDYEHFELNAREKGYALDQHKIRETLRREVGRVNEQLAPFKRIKDFQLRDEELPKTSTKKVKRYLMEGEAVPAPPSKGD
ncbi:MAG: AMP-binding protein [bacterium]|nr:AMP-binding protein [bacterium]